MDPNSNPPNLSDLTVSRRRFLQGAATLATLTACAPAGSALLTSDGAPWLSDRQAAAPLLLTTDTVGDSLEPGLWHGMGMARVFDYVGGYLTQPNRSGQHGDPPEGGVAEQWAVSAHGLTYTFTLRRGLTFHDGSAVDATAVVRSLTRQVNPADPSYRADCAMHTNYTFNRKAIHVADPATVVIELERPDPAYLYRLYHPAAMILSLSALDQCKGGIQSHLVSCGPYQIEHFVPRTEISLTAFGGFWAGRPPTERIIIRANVIMV